MLCFDELGCDSKEEDGPAAAAIMSGSRAASRRENFVCFDVGGTGAVSSSRSAASAASSERECILETGKGGCRQHFYMAKPGVQPGL
jgi:hypothetical protein